ncbi:MAG: VOC family protein [Clostridiales bacterium]|nr:VOC family protein [Clostridiales bacterium]
MNLPVLGTYTPSQVAVICHDIEATKKAYALFLGKEVPPTVDAGEYSVTKTEYYGQANPDASCVMAFFDLGNIQLELIQPNEAKSTWRDFLEKNGEGLHHLAFNVPDINKAMDDMKAQGFELTQFGYYGDGSGAYAYFDATKQLKCFVELLCSF